MREAYKRLLVPNNVGWDPGSYERYFGTLLGATIRRREEKLVFEALGSFMGPSDLILEVGPGTGNYTFPVARRCARLVAADSSPEMLRYLKDLSVREGLSNVELREGRLPDEIGTGSEEKFDGVLTVGTLNYIEDVGAAIRSLASVLRPDGWIVFTVPLSSIEGRVYALTELVNRRAIQLHSPENAATLAGNAGLRVVNTASTGFSRFGLTLVIGAVASDVLPESEEETNMCRLP